MTIESAELFGDNYIDLFRDILEPETKEYILAGGRGSLKSSFVSLMIIILLVSHQDWNALILRKVGKSLKDSVYAQILWAINKIGLDNYFRAYISPLKIVYLPTGQEILFSGVDDAVKLKSIKARRGYFALTWFEESAEFAPRDIIDVKLSTLRGGNVFKTFRTFNPPSSPRHWANRELLENKKSVIKHASNYLHVPNEWLGHAFLDEAEHYKTTRPTEYRNIFLGEAVGTGKNIFENIEIRQITDDEIASQEYYYFGMDWGWYPDPTRYVAMSYDDGRRELKIFDELTMFKTNNITGSARLQEHLKDKKYLHYWTDAAIIADNVAKDIADYKDMGWNIRSARKGAGSVDAGFKWLQGLGKIVIDPERAPETADEFLNYEYELDLKTGELMGGYPQGQPDHSMASVRYALEQVWMRRGM